MKRMTVSAATSRLAPAMRTLPVLLGLSLTVLAGCVSVPAPRMEHTAVLPPPAARPLEDDSKSLESAPPKLPAKLQIGTGQTINDAAGAKAPPNHVAAAGPNDETTFNFEGYVKGVKPSDLAGWDAPILPRSPK